MPPFFVPVSAETDGKGVSSLDKQLTWLAEVDQFERDQWRLDPEKSYCDFTWQPVIVRGEKRYWVRTTIEIRPYPNPLSYGGSYGSSTCQTLEDVEQAKAAFLKEAEHWRVNGMTRFTEHEEGLVNLDYRWQVEREIASLPHKLDSRQLVMDFED
jgi:hypothetical protein